MAGLFGKNTPEPSENYTLFVLEDAPEEEIAEPSDSGFIVEDDIPEDALASKNTFLSRRIAIFIPVSGDRGDVITRKIVAILAALTAVASLVYLIGELWIVPLGNESVNAQVSDMYDPIEFAPEVEEFENYPADMNPAFKALYYENADVRGWLSFPSTSQDWYGIDYPVVQAEDNDKYLDLDFFGNKNKNGTLFFDYTNDFSSPDAQNRVSVIYGHNMLSGQMFASLNKLLFNVGMARSAPVINLNTLYEDASYKVFSVFIWDNQRPDFNYMQTAFTSDEEFMAYVQQVRDRSWYDYPDVDVRPQDELLVLSTCSNTSQTHLSDGRTVVVARKIRTGESRNIVTAHIVKNPDPLQPIAWYEAEDLPLPSYYDITTASTTATTTTTTTTTTASGSGTESTTAGSSSTTTTGSTTTAGTTKATTTKKTTTKKTTKSTSTPTTTKKTGASSNKKTSTTTTTTTAKTTDSGTSTQTDASNATPSN